jgi:hypothetical protein
MDIPIDGGSYVSDSLPISNQQAVNCFVNIPQTSTVTTASIFGTPGITELVSVSDIDVRRGEVVMASIPYYVVGAKLYRIDRTITDGVATFTAADTGTVAGTGLVYVRTNGTQIVIVVPGVIAYTYTVGDGLVEIDDANFDGPVDTVEYINSFFTFTTSDGKKAFNSPVGDARGLPNGAPYDALDFFLAQADPDQIRGQVNYNNILYVLGSETTQPFRTTDRVPAPFRPIDNTVFNKGLAAVNSIVKTQSSFAFIGAGENESPAIWEFTGNGFRKLSTTAIETTLSELNDIALGKVSAWSYAESGAYFIGFSLPDTAIVYDSVTGKWADRISTQDSADFTWRAAGMLAAYGQILVGDQLSGKIGQLDKDVYKEYGNVIKRRVVLRPFDNEGKDIHVNSLEIVMEAGVGNKDVIDPQVRRSWSFDQGRTFSDQVARSVGKVGEHNLRQIWNGQGMFSPNAVLQIDFSDPAKFVISKVRAN